MRDSYPDDIMLCFVQGFGDRENGYNKSRESVDRDGLEASVQKSSIKKESKNRVSTIKDSTTVVSPGGIQTQDSNNFAKGKSLRISRDIAVKGLFEVKRSLSDRFSVINDSSGKKTPKGLLTIRKTWSTGNFASSAGGGCGAPRSAPATPLQLEPHPRTKHDKHAVKPLSGSAPSVSAGTLASDEKAKEGKQPSKSRQKKFQRHFPQVGPEERVLNYYSCALVGDLLLQGHLYITKNYFAFYSNVFGYVTKLLIPTSSVSRITKEKVARIIPNAVGVCTRDERHVFGSLLSRDSTYKLMMHVWKSTRVLEQAVAKPPDLRTSEVEASEYSPEDDSSSGGADHTDAPTTPARPEPESIIAAASATVIQPGLLTGTTGSISLSQSPPYWHAALLVLVAVLTCSAFFFSYRLFSTESPEAASGQELYSELARWRERLHGQAAHELHAFLSTNLLLLTKVRQSLEALSGVILADMAQGAVNVDVPNETAFS